MSDTPSWIVILSKPGARDPMLLAKALAAARKTPLQDQMMTAKKGWGIVAERLEEAAAKMAAQELVQAGIDAVALPGASLASLPETKPATTWEALSAAAPLLIAAAAITTSSTSTKMIKEGPSGAQKILSTAILLGTGLPIKIGGRDRMVAKTQHHSEMAFCLDVFYAGVPGRLRVDAARFDYSFLKERKLFQMMGNFKLLLGDLRKASPGVWLNHGASVLLEGKPMQTMGYESPGDLEREARWLLTIQSLPK